MAWRREDWGYGAATLAAAIFLAYLIAGNFGLVPSPLGRGRADGLPQAEIAALAASNTGIQNLPAPDIAARSDIGGVIPVVAKPAPLGRPTVHIDTPSGTSVKLTQKALVMGRVAAPAGVKEVVVGFKSSGTSTAVAVLRCASPQNCAWSVPVPATVGTFNITAVALDKAGRTAFSNSITMTVVNTGNVVGGVVQGVNTTVGSVGTLVTKAPGLLTGVVNNLLGALHL